jgi:hypothetical protein
MNESFDLLFQNSSVYITSNNDEITFSHQIVIPELFDAGKKEEGRSAKNFFFFLALVEFTTTLKNCSNTQIHIASLTLVKNFVIIIESSHSSLVNRIVAFRKQLQSSSNTCCTNLFRNYHIEWMGFLY